jgi:hypothetical protein
MPYKVSKAFIGEFPAGIVTVVDKEDGEIESLTIQTPTGKVIFYGVQETQDLLDTLLDILEAE